MVSNYYYYYVIVNVCFVLIRLKCFRRADCVEGRCVFVCVRAGAQTVSWELCFQDWVVSKFGRVLPIVQLRCQKGKKARTLKYDPSKFSHNIRRLDAATSDQLTPVTQLTWEVQGGDNEISKKRRGEFPPYVPPTPKKSRTEVVKSHEAVDR